MLTFAAVANPDGEDGRASEITALQSNMDRNPEIVFAMRSGVRIGMP
jgi:hypothetical protein